MTWRRESFTGPRMQMLRHHMRAYPLIAMLVVVLALCAKMLVPTGYMLGADAQRITVTICDSGVDGHVVASIAIPMDRSAPGSGGKGNGSDRGGDKSGSACPFGSLSMGALSGADAIQLAQALRIIIALGFVAAALPALRRTAYILPPLRGPPLTV